LRNIRVGIEIWLLPRIRTSYMFFFFNKIRGQEGKTSSAQRQDEGAKIMYTHVSKCKNDKIKLKKRKYLKKLY
jgi:hypothetical protein